MSSLRPSVRTLLRPISMAALWIFSAFLLFSVYQIVIILPVDMSRALQRPPTISVTDTHGTMLNRDGTGYRHDIAFSDLPPYIPQALVSIEDRRFYSHIGIDPIGLLRATWRNLLAGQFIEGGSTLSQQLAKNLFLNPERTLLRKFREIIIAIWIETRYSKKEIIAFYLNHVYFGAGNHGIEAASHSFFGKSVRKLSLSEAAFLIGLLKSPSRYTAKHNTELALERQKTVLYTMYRDQHISHEVYQDALSKPLPLLSRQGLDSASYVVDWVKILLPGFLGTINSDLIVETTIDKSIQDIADHALRSVLDAQDPKRNAHQGAIVVLDTHGAVKSIIGGKSYAESQFNRAVNAFRQPGSAFKPFVYLTALEHGFSPDSRQNDSPRQFGNWKPSNHHNIYRGVITLRESLASSSNVVAVSLAQQLKVKNIINTARRLGISSRLKHDLSIALGTSEVNLLELSAAFVPFANGGYGILPHIVTRISRHSDGTVLYSRSGSGPGRVIAPHHVMDMRDMLSATIAQGTGHNASIDHIPVAGKTGTSQDSRDAWFIGFTPHVVAGVWIGNDDNSPMNGVSGPTLPTEVWRRIIEKIHDKIPPLPPHSPAP